MQDMNENQEMKMEKESATNSSSTPAGKSNMIPMMIIAAVVVIAGLAFFMMRSKGANSSATTADNSASTGGDQMSSVSTASSSQPSASPIVLDLTADTSDVKIVNVEAGSFYYKPNEIHVKKGAKLKIVMTSKDMMHDFNIDELNVHMPITKSGQTNTVEFTADKVGSFQYYCSVGQHRAHGQVGTLVVTE